MICVGNTFQFDIEALIPINRPSGSNGVIAQLHLYLNDPSRHRQTAVRRPRPACKPFPRN
jgi:hypothetical protein